MEPISPELVLVSPELRERAFQLQPEPYWEVALVLARQRARAAPVDEPEPSMLQAAASVVGRLVELAVVVAVATAGITLALTLIANATATR